MLDYLNIQTATFLGLSNGGRVISKIADIKPQAVNALIYIASSGFLEAEDRDDKSVSQKEIDDLIGQYPSLIEANSLTLNIQKSIQTG